MEWIFQKFSERNIQKNKIKESAYLVRTEDEIIALKTLLAFILKDDSIPLFAGKGMGRASYDCILLPECVSYFSNADLNRQILIHKVLVAGIIFSKKITYTKKNLSYAERTLEIYNHQDQIRFELTALFPMFQKFNLLLENNLSKIHSKSKNEEASYPKLIELNNPEPFSRWQCFPEQALALWVELLECSNAKQESSESVNNSDKKKTNEGTQVEGNSSTEAIEEVSLEKKKKEQSPVFHSFEKLEAADEYNGGSRVSDSTDEIEDHQQALSELNLRHVTREGGGAGSVYKGHFSELFGSSLIKEPAARYNHYIKTPEWNYKKNELAPDHCRLYLLDENFSESSEKQEVSDDFLLKLNNTYSADVELWKNKIWSLVNQRNWKDRQLDGPEWNLDAYTRYCADVKASGQGDNKIFIKNFRSQRDFHVSILMDLSLSSESWVQNKKVLDVQLESIGLCGLLLQELNEPISISTTWSETRHHCYLQKIKNFTSPWSHFFNQANHLTPRGYTRLGPALRHTISELEKTSGKKKLLILLTDGKPTDLDQYEGRYGIEDMRHAMIEAQQAGVHVQALAIDSEAKFYFPQIFSTNNYQILSDPKFLPEQLFKIYFNFTRQD
ncbi:MAG: VWA domain-containing protein [Pseudobdellovibrio sp.]